MRPSRREIEIARLIALGKTYKDIARELGIAPRTVDSHRHRLYREVKARGIADITRWCIRMGLVEA